MSFGAGMGIGVLYALLRVTPPAPPFLCLMGLAGMLIGYAAPGWVS
ncbi:DUF1427 family protein [Streptomyces sp. NPDC005435]